MLLHESSRFLPRRFRLVLTSFLQRPGLPFAHVLSEEQIQTAFDDENGLFATEEEGVYTPAVTLWASFLSQVLFKDEQRSCVAAVAIIDNRLILESPYKQRLKATRCETIQTGT